MASRQGEGRTSRTRATRTSLGRMRLALVGLVAGCLATVGLRGGAVARAAEVQVAVAANFAGALKELAGAFAAQGKHRVVPVVGATGKLAAQIQSGAPFDVFLSADAESPAKLEAAGLGVKGSRFTYALGRLALYSEDAKLVDGAGAILTAGTFRHLAVANPKLAPYGVAAYAVLARLGLREKLASKIVEGESVAQTLAFVVSGNAELGFVALAQIVAPGQARRGSWWTVPASLHAPLTQDAVWLSRAAGNEAARAFMAFLASDEARAIIRSQGYDLPGRGAAAGR